MTKAGTCLAALAVIAALAVAAPATAAPSIAVCNGAASTSACAGAPFDSVDGVYFQVAAGGGNRDFASVAVDCDNGYSTVLAVQTVDKVGDSQTIHPPAGSSCTATLEKLMQIGKARILAGPVSFTVT